MNILELPKIELHCHLDGSIRPETILELAKKEGIYASSFDIAQVREAVIAPLECTSLNEYLKRFDVPIKIMQNKENIKRIAFELFEDAAKENVKYMEIRFAPLLHLDKGLSIEEVIESVISGMKKAEESYDIHGNIILSCMRTMPVQAAFEVVEKGRAFLNKGVVAIDLASSENKDFAKDFIEPIKLAKDYGYGITIHAGETGIGENVLHAVEMLCAERIGHGVYIKDHKEAYDIVKSKNIFLEMCPSSNVQTKAVNSFKEHPLYDFHQNNILVTLNTDNRTVSDTNMTKECSILFEELNISLEDYRQIYLNSVNASFANNEIKEKLKKYI